MKKLVYFITSMVVIIGMSGCAGRGTGTVSSKISKFDNSKEVVMETAWVAPAEGGIAEISLGMTYRTSTPNVLYLLVNITKMTDYKIRSVAFNIDGETIIPTKDKEETKTNTLQVTNDICTYSYGVRTCTKGIKMKQSDKIFIAPSNLAKKILKAKKAFIRVDVGSKFIEGDLKADSFGNHVFKDSLSEFVQKM